MIKKWNMKKILLTVFASIFMMTNTFANYTEINKWYLDTSILLEVSENIKLDNLTNKLDTTTKKTLDNLIIRILENKYKNLIMMRINIKGEQIENKYSSLEQISNDDQRKLDIINYIALTVKSQELDNQITNKLDDLLVKIKSNNLESIIQEALHGYLEKIENNNTNWILDSQDANKYLIIKYLLSHL